MQKTADLEVQKLSITIERTLWQKACSNPSFRALLRILRVSAAAGVATFLSNLIPQLQAEPTIGGVPLVALALLFLDKYLRDKKVY